MDRTPDQAEPRPGTGRMLLRGMRRRCPRCGSGHLFRRYFTMVETCPRCGHRFEGRPEDGFFLGALTVNLAVTEGVLLLVLFGYIAVLAAGDGDVAMAPILIAAGLLSLALPIVFYPFAKTIWAAVECSLHAMMEQGPGEQGVRPRPGGR